MSTARLIAITGTIAIITDPGGALRATSREQGTAFQRGFAEANYATVGQALLWTLEQGLGEAFTPDVREAWTATFVLVSDTMAIGIERTGPLTSET